MSKVLLIVKRGVLLTLIFSAASIKGQGISGDEVSDKESPTGYILARELLNTLTCQLS